MEKIVCNISLGAKNQDVYIIGEKYSNKKTIQSFSMPVDEIPNFIIKHDIYDIVLKGPKTFTQQIEEKIKQQGLEKYTQNKIKFTYM